MGGNGKVSTEEVNEEITGRNSRQRELLVDAIDSTTGGAAISEGVYGGIGVMRAEAAAFVHSVSARISEEHVVREGNNNKVGIVGDPSRGTHAVTEQRSGVGWCEPHFRALFVDVSAVDPVEVV